MISFFRGTRREIPPRGREGCIVALKIELIYLENCSFDLEPNYEMSFDASQKGKGCVVYGTKLISGGGGSDGGDATLVVPAVDARFPPSD